MNTRIDSNLTTKKPDLSSTNICRGCLSTERKVFSATLFEDDFKDLTGIDVSPSDGLPQVVCYECAALLQKYFKFKTKVIKSHHILSQYLEDGTSVAVDNLKGPLLAQSKLQYYEIPYSSADKLEYENVIDVVEGDISVGIKIENEEVKEIAVELGDPHNEDDRGEPDSLNVIERELNHLIHSGSTNVLNNAEPEKQKEIKQEISSVADNINPVAFSSIGVKVEIKDESSFSAQDENISIEEWGNNQQSELKSAAATNKSNHEQQRDQEEAWRDLRYPSISTDDHLDERADTTSICPEEGDGEHIESKDNSSNDNSCTNTESYICNDCNYCFNNKILFIAHVRNHSQDRPYACDVCKKRFIDRDHLNKHMYVHTDDKPFKCDVCTKSFHRKKSLNLHKRLHSDGNPYECDVCKKCFTTKGAYTVHTRTHNGEKPFKCDICSKAFVTRSCLQKHFPKHTGEKRYKCDVCMKCFKYKSNLDGHMRIHTGEKPYECNYCKKCFIGSGDYTRHIRIHTGEKPYKCDVCMKAFIKSSHLNNHVRIHTGEKPYKCDVCLKAFIRKGHLNAHARVHTGEKPFKCGVCMKSFSSESYFGVHKRIHAGVKPFQCSVCMKSFNTSGNHARHMRVHT